MLITEGLKIDWVLMPTYNTIMSVAAGAGLLSLVWLARSLLRGEALDMRAWALSLGVPGWILTLTGLHMTLTWPMATYFPFDNIIFGETSLGFGVLLVAASFYLWRRSDAIDASGDPLMHLARAAKPMSIFIIGMGLALGAIAFAGLIFQLFAAPAEEPISGAFADTPWVEAIFMSGMFGFVGIGAVLFPFALPTKPSSRPTPLQRIVGIIWGLSGLGFLLFGALNFFTHIGLIINTM